jgi:hypothetical protein
VKSSGTTRRAEGTDQRKLWIPEEVDCRLQVGVPSCSSGTAQEKYEYLQENSDPWKLWRNLPQPARRRPAVQKWHSARDSNLHSGWSLSLAVRWHQRHTCALSQY